MHMHIHTYIPTLANTPIDTCTCFFMHCFLHGRLCRKTPVAPKHQARVMVVRHRAPLSSDRLSTHTVSASNLEYLQESPKTDSRSQDEDYIRTAMPRPIASLLMSLVRSIKAALRQKMRLGQALSASVRDDQTAVGVEAAHVDFVYSLLRNRCKA